MKKIKLNVLKNDVISSKEMSSLKGGNNCGCSCFYKDRGGSSVADNQSANWNGNLESVDGDNKYRKMTIIGHF